MKSTVLAYLLALLLSSTGLAAILEEGVGIIYGTDHTFSLKAPKGWVLDNESAVEQGVHAVFYPKGSTWKESAVVAYARARPKTDTIATAEHAAEAVVQDFRANGNPKYKAKRVKTLKNGAGREAVIYHFTGDQWGNSEAVAYYVEEKTINFIVMNSRDPKLFAKSQAAFEALAKSYLFIGDRPMAVDKPGGKVEVLTADGFEDVRALAQKMGETDAGKAYEKRFSEAIADSLQAALRDCVKDVTGPQVVRLVFVIGADGTMKRIIRGPADMISACVANKLTGIKLPAPPEAEWKVLLNLTIKE